MAAQKPKTLFIEISVAGTRQRLVPLSTPFADRFVTSVYFEAFYGNTGKVFIGDENVVDGIYVTALTAGQGSEWNGDQLLGAGSTMKNKIDLANVWVDASSTSDYLMASYSVEITGEE